MKLSLNWLNKLSKKQFPLSSNSSQKLLYAGLDLDTLALKGFEVDQIYQQNSKNCQDIIVEFDTTPNRIDSNSIVGMCRELNISLGLKLKPLTWSHQKNQNLKPISIRNNHKFKINKKREVFYCQIHNLTQSQSPPWLQKRLLSYNIKPENNIIDLAHYVRIEWGQPLQIYDLQKLKQTNVGKLNLSLKPNTKPTNIIYQNKDYELPEKVLNICNEKKPISIAGFGESSKLKIDNTTNGILLECITYNRTELKEALNVVQAYEETSKIYSKGIPKEHTKATMQRTLKLFQLLHPNCNIVINNIETKSLKPKNLQIEYNTIRNTLGLTKYNKQLTKLEIQQCLKNLNFKYKEEKPESLKITIPQFRSFDLENKIDVVEEIGRCYGFNNFISKLPNIKAIGTLNKENLILDDIKTNLVNQGFIELMNFTFTTEPTQTSYALLNPLGLGTFLQTSLIENLITTIKLNTKQQNNIKRGFEVGHIFIKEKQQEATFLAGFSCNEYTQNDWIDKKYFKTWLNFKFEIENLLKLFVNEIEWHTIKKNIGPWFHNQKSALIVAQNTPIGLYTQINPIYAKRNSIEKNTYIFEINLTLLSKISAKIKKKYSEFSLYPSITRDISLPISTQVPISKQLNYITNLCQQVNKKLNPKIQIITIYPTSKTTNMITYNFSFNLPERTLTNEEIETWMTTFQKLLDNKKDLTK